MDRYPVEVPGREYWRRQISCQDACPVHTDARGYVRAIAAGRLKEAYLIARGPNPLASICGRVCGAPCEAACRRGALDEAIGIRALKRFVGERFGPEAGVGGGQLMAMLREAVRRGWPSSCRGGEEIVSLLRMVGGERFVRPAGKRVGIIGSGPAGLAAAHDLALLGFQVTLYEMEPVLGGMLAVGIPKYRLPWELIQAEVEVIRALGVEAVTGCCVGRDVSFPDLRAEHDAVIVAVGAKRSRKLALPGGDAQGVLGGVEFLREVALGHSVRLGRRVVIVGGGDAAMDAARTALRVRADEEEAGEQGEHYLAMDAARVASRLGGREVHIVYRRSQAEMPAVRSEIEEAQEEGVRFHVLSNPVRVEQDDQGAVAGLWCQKMRLGEPDASGRRRPVPIEGSEFFMPADNVVMAIGQTYDLSLIDPERDGLTMAEDGRIACDPERGTTSAEDVFVAGDLAYGPKLLIHAVASGKAVARSVYQRLTGCRITPRALDLHFPLPLYEREADYEKRRRVRPRALPVTDRLQGADRPVQLGFGPEEAVREAGRCLDCGVNTIFDGERCVLCGGCADVCPQRCLRLVPANQLAGSDALAEVLAHQLGDHPPGAASAIIKDETACIRCGLCAERCPTGAITMERLRFQERLQCQTGARAS